MSSLPHNDHDTPPVPNTDRRLHPRQPIVPRLYVILDAAKTDGILNDASETGVALDIVGPAPQEDFIAVDFEMSEIGQRFEARGRIMWRDDATGKVGVHFDNLPEVSRNQIRKWLAKKAPVVPVVAPELSVSAPLTPSPILMEPPASTPTPPAIPAAPLVPAVLALPAAPEQQPSLKPVGEKNYEVITGSHAESAGGVIRGPISVPPSAAPNPAPGPERSPAPSAPPPPKDDPERDRIVQNLLDSFSAPTKPSSGVAAKAGVPGIFSATQNVVPVSGRNWTAITIAAALMLLLALGFLAYRSMARNAAPEPISVSKAGIPPAANAGSANLGAPPLGSSNAPGTSSVGGPAGASGSLNSSAHSSCVPLGPPSDKVRLFLWAEKETPQALVDAYVKNLGMVQDVRVVDQPPYDLVLYLNGAIVDAKGSGPGYLWSTRVFRPWHCGEAFGQLEQTEVNESLHFVQGDRLDQRVQAEIAYLILHTFESIRNESTK